MTIQKDQEKALTQAEFERQKRIDFAAQALSQGGYNRGLGGFLKDTGLSLISGAVAVPEMAVGLLDIPTGGRVGKFLENQDGMIGFRPSEARQALNDWKSDEAKMQMAQYRNADGVMAKAGKVLSNPTLLTDAIADSAPMMGAGAVIGRGVGLAHKGLSALSRGAIGEGIAMAGSSASQQRAESKNRLLNTKQALGAIGTGVAGAGFGYLGGRLAQEWGVDDIDTAMVRGSLADDTARKLSQEQIDAKLLAGEIGNGTTNRAVGGLKGLAKGAVLEGFAEELPQTLSETAFANWANDRPLTHDMTNNAVLATLSGMAMGMPMGAVAGVNHAAKNKEMQERREQFLKAEQNNYQQFHQNMPSNLAIPSANDSHHNLSAIDITPTPIGFHSGTDLPVSSVNSDNVYSLSSDVQQQFGVQNLPDNLPSASNDLNYQSPSTELQNLGQASPTQLTNAANDDDHHQTDFDNANHFNTELSDSNAILQDMEQVLGVPNADNAGLVDNAQIPTDDIKYTAQTIDSTKPSQQLGLDPNQGSLTRSAIVAVDSGASDAMTSQTDNQGVEISAFRHIPQDGEQDAIQGMPMSVSEPPLTHQTRSYHKNNPYANYTTKPDGTIDDEIKQNADNWESRLPALTQPKLAEFNAKAQKGGFNTHVENHHADLGVFKADKYVGDYHIDIDGYFKNNDGQTAKDDPTDFTAYVFYQGEHLRTDDGSVVKISTNNLDEVLQQSEKWLEAIKTQPNAKQPHITEQVKNTIAGKIGERAIDNTVDNQEISDNKPNKLTQEKQKVKDSLPEGWNGSNISKQRKAIQTVLANVSDPSFLGVKSTTNISKKEREQAIEAIKEWLGVEPTTRQQKQEYFPNKFAKAINDNAIKSMSSEQLKAINAMFDGKGLDKSVFDTPKSTKSSLAQKVENHPDFGKFASTKDKHLQRNLLGDIIHDVQQELKAKDFESYKQYVKNKDEYVNAIFDELTKEQSDDDTSRTQSTPNNVLANTPSDSVGRNATERATTSIHSKTGGKSTRRNQNQSDNGYDNERSSSVQFDGAKTGIWQRVNKKQPILTPKDKAKQVLQGEAVAYVDESKLNMPMSGGYKAVTTWAMGLFNQWGNVANNPVLGNVVLNEQSIKDSISHDKKLNPYKNLALASIKDVLEKGVLIHADYKTKGEDSFYIAAPVMLNDNKNIVTVLVHRDVNTQRMYLHYVGLVEKLMQSHQNMTVARDKTSRKHNRSATASDIASIIQELLDVKTNTTQPPTTTLENAITTNDVAKIDFDELTPSQQSALNALEKLPDSDPKKAEFMDAIYGVGTTDSEQDKKARRELVGRITTYEMVKRNAKKLADELSELGYDVKVADSTLFDNTKEVATQLTAKKSGKTLNVMVNKTLPQGRSNDSVRDGFFVKDGNVSYRIDFNELNIAQRIDNHTDYVSNKEYFGVNRPVYRQNAKPTDWQQRMAGQMARLFDDDPALPQFIELANQRNLSTSHKNSLIGSITSYADVQFKKGNALQKDDVIGKNNDEYHQGKIKFSRMGSVVAPISEQAKVLQGEAVVVIDESTLDMPTQGGFKAIEKWATELFKQQGSKAINPVLGEITLNHRSVKDSLAHGKFSSFKNIAFAGVKDVLEKGVIIAIDNEQSAHDSYFISAPITINGKENVVTVTLHKDNTSQKMYLHGVMVKESLLKPRVSEARRVNSRQHIGSLTSTDIHNILHHALTYKQNSKKGGRYHTTPSDVLEVLSNRFGKDTIKALQANDSLKVLTLAEAKDKFGNIPNDTDGFYANGTAYLVHDNIHPDMIVPTFLHELGGHGGFETLMSKQAHHSLLKEFHDMVAKGDETAKQAKDLADKHSRTQAEANSEYLAYMITLASRNNSSKAKSLINRVIMAVKTFLKNTFGISLALTPNDILALSEKMVRDRANGQVDNGVDDVQFSLDERMESDFANAIDDFLAGRKIPNNITLGTTPDVLKMLGMPDVAVKIKDNRFAKILNDKHALKPERLKQLPKQLNNPVAVLKSSPNSTNPDGYVVLTELTEFNREKQISEPVIVALSINKDGTVIDVSSAYGKNHQGLQNMLDDDKVLYWHKEKGLNFVNVHRLQLPLKLRSSSTLLLANIKTNDDLSQYQQQNNGDTNLDNLDIQFSKSALKSVSANIKRGQKAITKAIVEKTSVHRAMYRSDIGWIDFVWGDTGRIRPNGKTKGAMGISHIFDSRTRKDGMSYADVVDMLHNDMVNAIAKGRQYDVVERDNTIRLRIIHDNHLVSLIKNKGSNAWVLTSFDIKNPTVDKGGVATSQSLRTNSPIRTRADVGALDSDGSISNNPTLDNLDIQFSRMADMADFYDKNQDKAKEVLGKLGGVVNDFLNNPKAFAKSAKQDVGGKAQDHLGKFLQFLGRWQMVDLFAKKLDGLKAYSDRVAQMDADSNENAFRADQLAVRWGKLKDEQALVELMHDVTLKGIDPSKPRQSGINGVQYGQLKSRYDKLSDDAKAVFNQARDDYQEYYKNLHEAMKGRIKRNTKLSNERKTKLLDELDKQYQATQKVFFPLTRFGDYVIVVKDTDGNVVNMARAETKGKADEIRRELIRDNPNHHVGQVVLGRELDIRRLGGIKDLAGEFLTDELDLGNDLHQAYLNSLLDRQFANNNIELKNTAGFSQNARRAYAYHMSRGGHHIAKLRHTDRLKSDLERMQKHIDDNVDNPDFDHITMQRVVDEMEKRHKLLINPPSNPLSTIATSAGFIWYMGLSPASALVNVSQTFLVALPFMGAKFGIIKSVKMLGEVSKLLATNKNDLTDVLTGDEQKAFLEAVRRGVIDMTQAHDLAGIANGEDSRVSRALQKPMKIASFMFHHAEKYNRQVTYLASYRLGIEKGLSPEQAMEQAIKLTYDSHFDYASSNRPRFMIGNWQKVLFLFKQYAQNMIFTLTRQTYLAFKGETAQARTEARKILAGILGGHALMAGALGLPSAITVPFLAVFSALGGDDDDELTDNETEFRNALVSLIGDDMAEVIAKGVPRAIGADLSGRVGLDSLILPRMQDGLEGQRLGENILAGLAGPVAGIGISVAKGVNQYKDGQKIQGIENMIPKALRDPLKAYRYAKQGNVDKNGIEIVEREHIGISDIAQQAIGFRSGKFANAQETKSAIYQADKRLTKMRSDLVRQYAFAKHDGDDERMDEIWQAIQRFNAKYPSNKITKPKLMQYIRQRQKKIDNAKDGIYLSKNREHLREVGAFGIQ